MNALAHWNQFKELEALHNSLGSLFGRPQAQRLEGQEELMRVPEWTPLVDISEDTKEYLIKAELPEVKKEDVKITMEDGTLTITADFKDGVLKVHLAKNEKPRPQQVEVSVN